MLTQLDADQLRAYCLGRQHLTTSSKGFEVVRVADDLCGLQATSTVTPYISLYNRLKKFSPAMLDSELVELHTLVRIRGVRGTLFIVPKRRAQTIRCALGMLPEPSQRWFSRLRMERREFRDLRKTVIDGLQGKPLSIKEIKGLVPRSRIRTISFQESKSVVRSATNVTWVVNWLIKNGIVLGEKVGGLRDALRTRRTSPDFIEPLSNRYVLSSDLMQDIPPIGRKEAQEALVRWYLDNYAPVTLQDISWWTGMLKGNVDRIVKQIANLTTVRVSGVETPLILREEDMDSLMRSRIDQPEVNLLPYEDSFLKGYKLRFRFGETRAVEKAYRTSLGTGVALPTVMVDGKIVGIWWFLAAEDKIDFRVQMITKVDSTVRTAITERANETAGFLFPKEKIGLQIQ